MNDKINSNLTGQEGDHILSKEDVKNKVIEIICEKLSKDKDSVTLESTFIKDLGADSLDMVEIVMAFEEKFDIKIPDNDVEKISTVQESINYVYDVLSKKS